MGERFLRDHPTSAALLTILCVFYRAHSQWSCSRTVALSVRTGPPFRPLHMRRKQLGTRWPTAAVSSWRRTPWQYRRKKGRDLYCSSFNPQWHDFVCCTSMCVYINESKNPTSQEGGARTHLSIDFIYVLLVIMATNVDKLVDWLLRSLGKRLQVSSSALWEAMGCRLALDI